MTENPYLAFLPEKHQAAARREAEESWWAWRDHTVHIARAHNPEAPARVLVVHGAGAHSGALWPVAALLADEGLDVAAVDLPLYGRTVTADPEQVRYTDWIDLLVDLVAAEDDGRRLILLGASIGGLLTCEVAARTPLVSHVVATCLLDPADWRARAHMTRFGPVGILGRAMSVLARGPIATASIPLSWVGDLAAMSRNPELSRLCATDPLGGGKSIPVGFLASYMRHRHTPPEEMTTPVTLLHPGLDDWTPVELSARVLRRMAAPSRLFMLRNCGHFPIEEPGLSDLVSEVARLY